jgi:hypothetical protein
MLIPFQLWIPFLLFFTLDNTIVPLNDPLLWDQHLLDPLLLIQQQLQQGP